MICFWRTLCSFLLLAQCAWVVVKPNTLAHDISAAASSSVVQEPDISITEEYSLQMNQTNIYGLPKCIQQWGRCRHIGIIGAGVAGLYSAILLAKSGHTVTIYEASDRVGGRIFTYRDAQNPTAYMSELGAMRFPLDAHPYLNSLIRQRYQLNVTEFQMADDNTYVYVNGILARAKQARENPDMFGFNTSQRERGKTPEQLWNDALQPVLNTSSQQNWSSVRNKWDSYSIDSYLNQMNMSRAAIDYMGLFSNFETSLYISILVGVRDPLVVNDQTKFYRIQGGNDLLVQSILAEWEVLQGNRSPIVSSTPVTGVHVLASGRVRVRAKNGTSIVYDSVIAATTARAAQLIEFEPRADFADKYRVMRQLHYECNTKIFLFFNVSWWYLQENISGGRSITDLPVRFIYYPTTNNNQTDGGAVLASYTWSDDSILWQSLSDSEAIELALNDLIKIHRSSTNMRDYFQGGKVKHWCNDPYAHGGAAVFIPFQETDLLDRLRASVSNVHFIGEHTSLQHAWVEGALVSALRSALLISAQAEPTFDVIIVGGNSISLITAVLLSLKQPTFRIAIVEQSALMNSEDSSRALDQWHYREMHDEEYLIELAKMSVPLWRRLERLAHMPFGSLLNMDNGHLFSGDFNARQSSIQDAVKSIKRACRQRRMVCEHLNSTQLQTRFPTLKFSSQHHGIFHNQAASINITMLTMALMRIIARRPNIIVREHEQFLSLKLGRQTHVVTDRSILRTSRKVLFVAGCHAKQIPHLLNFDLNTTLREYPVYYFRRFPNSTHLPSWFAVSEGNLQSIFSGFSITPLSGYIAVLPIFIRNASNRLSDPFELANTIDYATTGKVIKWVSHNLAMHVNLSDYDVLTDTWLTTISPKKGILLDYVPQTNHQVLVQAGGRGVKFLPIWADILSELILVNDGHTMKKSSKYAKYMKYFSLS